MKEEDAVLQFGRKNIKRAMTYKALNRLIQGSAADQVKKLWWIVRKLASYL
jgi:DNA polymerase I-like protein with 3'-5' exonuclease and polymerase domains